MRKFIRALLLLAVSSSSHAADFDDHFTIVFIDEVTESKYGSVPLDRALLAEAITAIANAGARGVVLKFFLDQAKDDTGDRLLARAISRLPVILQARIDNNEPAPNRLPDRFTLSLQTDTTLKGISGWIPDHHFSAVAPDVAFVDFNGFPVSLLETYQGRTVKSLLLSSIELAYGEKAVIEPLNQVAIGALTLKLDSLNQTAVILPALPVLKYIPFHDLLEQRDWMDRVRNKVVILGYDGPKIHSLDTDSGAVSAHRLFIQVLKVLVDNGH